ncbi:MAG: CoA-binding protein [Desulfobacterales bacterium]
MPHPLEEILHPRSIAIVGASTNPYSWGYSFTCHLLEYGYKGDIYPVNPKYDEILGLKSYPNLRDIPGHVDYVISCVPASGALDMLEDCAAKGVKGVHLYTARFSETGRPEAAELEQAVLAQAKKTGIRLIGPNCMGLYAPGEGIAFAYDLPKSSGPVGYISQSGGGAALFVHIAAMRGIGFSSVISYGNGLDLNESDYLDYFSRDPDTEIILMYVEGVKDGPRFFRSLKHAAATKPVIIVKGGRGRSGAQATASHTASLAGSMDTWEGAIGQAGAVSARNYDEMADLATLFRFLAPIRGVRVGIYGGGGGPSVLAADECEEAGLDVIPIPKAIRNELKTRAPEIWDWIGNPIDLSILPGASFTGIDMLRLMAEDPHFDFLIGQLTEVPLATREGTVMRSMGEIQEYVDIRDKAKKPLLVVLGEKSLATADYDHWRWKLTGDVRTELLAAGIPFLPSMKRAAEGVKKVIDYYQRRENL